MQRTCILGMMTDGSVPC